MNAEEDVILPGDERAARLATVKGWVSRHGRFYGNTAKSEELARLDGCTHRPCPGCGKLLPVREFLTCHDCRDAREWANFLSLEELEWDGGWIYSETLEEYYEEPGELLSALEEEHEGMTWEDARVRACRKVFGRLLDSDYFHDELPEDGDLPDELEEAVDAFNEVVSKVQLSWYPAKTRVKAPQEAA